jgi:hypothetical protein
MGLQNISVLRVMNIEIRAPAGSLQGGDVNWVSQNQNDKYTPRR